MEARKAFELKNLLIVYNFVQVILNMTLGVYVSPPKRKIKP